MRGPLEGYEARWCPIKYRENDPIKSSDRSQLVDIPYGNTPIQTARDLQ